MRRAVALLLAVGALVASAAGSAVAAFPEATFDNQCQYSYDDYWRPVPMIFGGKLTDAAGAELPQGAQLAVGDTVRLQDGTVSAILPTWIVTFAYESGMIGVGETNLPVSAWLALEATNTEQGITPPIALTTTARAHVELTSGGVVDEERSSIIVVAAPIPTQSWTATGGEVQLRQAMGESLPPLPLGRNGADVAVRGSLYVRAELGLFGNLFLDCLQGQQVNQGATHTDALPGAMGSFAVPGWTGTVDGTSLAARVDADLLQNQGPPRAGLEEQATILGASLRLRLTDAQRSAWLGNATTVTVSGTVPVDGAGSEESTQPLPVSQALTAPANGPATLIVPLPPSTWTATSNDGMLLRGPQTLTLDAAAGNQTRRLVLTRVAAGAPYPFARVLRPGPPPTPLPTPTATPTATTVPTVAPPAATPAATVAPTASPTPTPTPAAATVAVRSSKLKLAAKNRVAVSLRCTGAADCKGTIRLRTAAKVKLGKRAKRVLTLTGGTRYSVAAGKTVTVRLSLSRDGRALMRSSRRQSVRLELRPTGGKLQTSRLTLSK